MATATSGEWLPELARVAPPQALRIGFLIGVSRASVATQRGVEVWGLDETGRWSGLHATLPRATFIPAEQTVSVSQGTRFRVQLGSFSDEASARQVAQRAQGVGGDVANVRWNEATRSHQVRLGDYATRDEAMRAAGRLVASGFAGAFAAEELATVAAHALKLAETGDRMAMALVLPPAGLVELDVEAAAYRGAIEVRGDERGLLTVVNVVNLEDYLRGVVPNELSPLAYPEMEALKAQAVAARTYALKNLGQSAAKGYDLCATASCQVYKGRASEQPATDQAVEETRGQVLRFHGALINAMYTSTCGGHTENGENIFEGPATPYLRGVPCEPERSGWSVLRSRSGAGDTIGRDAALLVALGVGGAAQWGGREAETGALATDSEIRTAVGGVAAALARGPCVGPSEPGAARRGAFFHYLVDSLCWGERAERLVSARDADYLLQVGDRQSLRNRSERVAAALLVQEQVLRADSQNRLRPDRPLTRAVLISLLARIVDSVGEPALVPARFADVTESELVVRRAGGEARLALAPDLGVFRDLDGTRTPASEISLQVGEDVRYAVRDGRVVFVEVVQSRLGAAADRSSRHFRWESRLTPQEVERAVARYGSVGPVKDIVPRRLGVSGRVVELAVVGSRGELVLSGLKVRFGLGLKESLFVIEREMDGKAVKRFVFAGKGWGHGVGLCQVGAFGMAKAGATYEAILTHYYSGVQLARGY